MKKAIVSIHKAYSTDGIELDAVLYEPAKKTKRIIIHVHGKEGHFVQNHFVHVLGEQFAQNGYSFLTFNNRGHDYMADLLKRTSTGYTWEQGGSMFDILENCVLDIQGIIDYVINLGYSEIILQGHSLGPHKISYYLSQILNHFVSQVIFLTTADVHYQFDSSVPEWEKYSLFAKKMIDEGKGKDLMPIRLWSNCPVSAATFWNYTNPHNNCFVFNGTHPDKDFKNFNKINVPILIVNPENDVASGIQADKFMKLLKKNSISRDFEGYVLKNAVHNFLSKEEDLAQVILNWLNR